jgi:hypothetical protein
MLRAEREVVKREDAFTANEIEFRRLEQLHSQLESFLLQATLITGFAIGTLNADNLVAIIDDVGKFCIYKQPVTAHLYVVLTLFSMSSCMIAIGIGYYVTVRSEKSANEVSVRHTVALVRQLKGTVMCIYFVGLVAFLASLIALLWLYAGKNWVPLEGPPGDEPTRFATGSTPTGTCSIDATGTTGDPACDAYVANGWDTPIVTTDEGQTLVTCLNPFNATQQRRQNAIGLSWALSATLTFVIMGLVGLCAFIRVRALFLRLDEIVAREADGEASQIGSGPRPSASRKPIGPPPAPARALNGSVRRLSRVRFVLNNRDQDTQVPAAPSQVVRRGSSLMRYLNVTERPARWPVPSCRARTPARA